MKWETAEKCRKKGREEKGVKAGEIGRRKEDGMRDDRGRVSEG